MPTFETPKPRYEVVWLTPHEAEVLHVVGVISCDLCCIENLSNCMTIKKQLLSEAKQNYINCSTPPEGFVDGYIRDNHAEI